MRVGSAEGRRAMGIEVGEYVALENGDRLSREEFHRRYELRPDIHKAELVGGVVYLPSPVRYLYHGDQLGLVLIWLSVFVSRRVDIKMLTDTTFFLSDQDEVQPDAALFRLSELEDSLQVTDEGYLQGRPALVVEVAASSAA